MVENKQLRDELFRMFAEDQRTWGAVLQLVGSDEGFAVEFQRKFPERGGWNMAAIAEWSNPPPVVAECQAVQRHNSRRLREIMKTSGWPTRSAVGEDGADAAWLLLHHFGAIEFQQASLDHLLSLPLVSAT